MGNGHPASGAHAMSTMHGIVRSGPHPAACHRTDSARRDANHRTARVGVDTTSACSARCAYGG